MADLTITATNVVPVQAGHAFEDGIAGATITAGQAVVLNSANLWVLADADNVCYVTDKFGVAENGAAANQTIRVQVGGKIAIGGTVAIGQVYAVSTTAGGIAAIADLTTGKYIILLGIGVSVTEILLGIKPSGVAKA
jgi:hypothetical protein